MTVQSSAGPLITLGIEAALGSATAIVGSTGASAGYVTGSDNPDAGPNAFFAGSMFKDMRFRSRQGGGADTAPGGYPNQALGFVDHNLQTIDFVPAVAATANIAALQVPTINVPLTLVAVSGAGIFVEAAAVTVLATGNVVPAGSLRIGAAPGWNGYGTSGAMQGWTGVGIGRAVSLTSGVNLSGANYTIRGYDAYGAPMTQTLAGPNVNTVNTLKGFKWIASVTPGATNAGTVSIGTADIFSFPILARRFSQLDISWDETKVTANTGFVTAVTTNPLTAALGDVRGTFAVQTATDGVRRLVVNQRILAADIATLTSVYGQTQV